MSERTYQERQRAGDHRGDGDWLAYGEGRGEWGEMYAQAHDQTRMSYTTLRQEYYVSDRVPISSRVNTLSWSQFCHA